MFVGGFIEGNQSSKRKSFLKEVFVRIMSPEKGGFHRLAAVNAECESPSGVDWTVV